MEINGNVLSRSPIRRINFDDRTDLELHDRLVSIVDHMIDLQNCKVAAADAGEQERIQRLIDATDKQIDILVYELFGLSPEEIGLIREMYKSAKVDHPRGAGNQPLHKNYIIGKLTLETP